MTRLAVDLRRDTDGDVFDLAHDAISPGPVFCPIGSLRRNRIILCKGGEGYSD
jgi:hypothetical protein